MHHRREAMRMTGHALARTASSIRIEAVTKSFERGVPALDAVTLDVEAGEFFTLLGPSGCGKTTLLRVLAGLEQPDTGRIEIGGWSMAGVPPHRRSVNTVFQSYALFPHRNVRQNIGFGLEMQGVPGAEIAERSQAIAELTGIGALLERDVAQLSGGQRQRVALARALVNEPDVLLLDEPLSALDAGLRAHLQLELKRLQRRLGMTFVFVTHDQEEAMVMSDRIAVLNAGRIAQVDTPQGVYEAPADLFVARFMGHENFVPIRQRDAAGVDTAIGRLDGDFGAGSHLLLRPEAIRLDSEAAQSPNRFTARVRERLYRGGTTDYRLDCGEVQLMASCANRGQRAHEVGDTVEVGVSDRGTATLAG
ncbi:ABC transporter ATP-binding protein [Spiribacter insolitus]|uniref:ABC transporter ATP-binding protein n=1 Tax=Spiribacter insolitus TaxID=3122417 RepID=A0ABV3T931_9GAMM